MTVRFRLYTSTTTQAPNPVAHLHLKLHHGQQSQTVTRGSPTLLDVFVNPSLSAIVLTRGSDVLVVPTAEGQPVFREDCCMVVS